MKTGIGHDGDAKIASRTIRNAQAALGALALWTSAAAADSPLAGGSDQISAEAILSVACTQPLQGGVCVEAAGYYGGQVCLLEAAGDPIVGINLQGRRLALLPYRSNCEPHLHNWGGSLVVEVGGGALQFEGYLIGLSGIDSCLVQSFPQTGENFVCRYRYVGLGYELTDVAAYRIMKGEGGYSFHMTELATAADATATFGAPVLRCDQERELIDVDAPLKQLASGVIEAPVRLADRATIVESCEAQEAKPQRGVPPGSAIARRVQSERLRFDLTTRRHFSSRASEAGVSDCSRRLSRRSTRGRSALCRRGPGAGGMSHE